MNNLKYSSTNICLNKKLVPKLTSKRIDNVSRQEISVEYSRNKVVERLNVHKEKLVQSEREAGFFRAEPACGDKKRSMALNEVKVKTI